MPLLFPLSLPIVFEGTVSAFKTAGWIINRTALRVGVPGAEDPFASSDKNMVRLVALLEEVGQDLWDERHWSHLSRVGLLETVADQSAYPLPDGFGYLRSNTAWDRSQSVPIRGPITAEAWNAEKAFSTTSNLRLGIRLLNQQLQLLPEATPADREVAYEFQSRYWVQPTEATEPTRDELTAATDVVWFDPRLAIAALRFEWLDDMGFPSDGARLRYDRLLAKTASNDSPGETLNLASGSDYRGRPYPYTPDTW